MGVSVIRHVVAPTNFERFLDGKAEPRVACRLLEGVPWKSRDDHLTKLGFQPIPTEAWYEVAKSDALRLLTNILSFDLCYGTKNLSKSDAEAVAEEFMGRLHWQARYFTNSDTPWDPDSSAWGFSPLTNATIDSGVIAKVGDEFSGLLWVASWD